MSISVIYYKILGFTPQAKNLDLDRYLRNEINQQGIAELIAGLQRIKLRVNSDLTDDIKGIISEIDGCINFSAVRIALPFFDEFVGVLYDSRMQTTQVFERKCVV